MKANTDEEIDLDGNACSVYVNHLISKTRALELNPHIENALKKIQS